MSRSPIAQWIGGKARYLPEYASPPQPNEVACDGDSLTASGNTWANIITRFVVANIAVAAATIQGNGGNSITDRGPAFDTLRLARTPGVIWCGTNSIQNGVSGANCLTQMASYIATRRASGWTPANGNPLIGANCMRRNSAGFPQAERTAFNAGFGALDWDVVIDVSQGPPGSPGDGIYWNADNIHLTVLGQQWIFDRLFYPALLGLSLS